MGTSFVHLIAPAYQNPQQTVSLGRQICFQQSLMSHKMQTIMNRSFKQCVGQEQDQKILIIFPLQCVIWRKLQGPLVA